MMLMYKSTMIILMSISMTATIMMMIVMMMMMIMMMIVMMMRMTSQKMKTVMDGCANNEIMKVDNQR